MTEPGALKIPLIGYSTDTLSDLRRYSAARIPVLIIIVPSDGDFVGSKMAARFARTARSSQEIVDDANHIILDQPQTWQSCLPTSCINDPRASQFFATDA